MGGFLKASCQQQDMRGREGYDSTAAHRASQRERAARCPQKPWARLRPACQRDVQLGAGDV